MTEALQLWKKIAGKGGDGDPEDKKSSNPGGYIVLFSFIHYVFELSDSCV